MKTRENAEKRWVKMCVVLLLAVVMAGCQVLGSPRGRLLSEEARSPLQEKTMDGRSWSTRDLTVQYVAELKGNTLNTQGEVTFAPLLRKNYSYLERFHLGIIFADEEGRILDMQGLMSSVRSDFHHPHTYVKSLPVPSGTHYYAFRYTGEAVEGGSVDGGGKTSFFYYPVK